MALAIDIARPLRSRTDQQALVRAVYEAPGDEQETSWLEWKGSLALSGRDATGRATIAKAVLGFANRDPNAAARAMTGCAYLLAGVSPGELLGVEAVDAAQLEAQVATYVGRNIDWRADYAVVHERSVLVITVEPPQWGDPMHPVRKTFNPADRRGPVLQEGTVFVRQQASTDPATPSDIDMLSRRAARRPGDQLDVQVRSAPETNLRAIDLSAEALHEYVLQEESNLLAPHSPPERRFPGHPAYKQEFAAAFVRLGREHRGEEEYRAEVGGYLERLREELPRILPARSVLHDVARLKLEVVNNTEATFTNVQVEVKLPPEHWVTEWQYEVRSNAELPNPPRAYGGLRLPAYASALPFIRSAVTRPAISASRWRPDVDRRSDAVYVEYVPEDVRAQGVAPLPSVWLVIADPATEAVEVRWEATATNAERRLSGTITVPVNHPPASVQELTADLPDDDD